MTAASAARRTARGNRWGLVLAGVVLVALAVPALAAGRGLLGQGAAAEELDAVGAAGAWLPYAVLAAAVVVGLLALRWIFVQGRTGAVRRLVVDPESRSGTTEMPAGAARSAFEEAVGEYAGVRRARLRMTASARAPHVRLDLTVDEDADVPALWRRVRAEALEDLRSALDLDGLPAVVRMSMVPPPKNPRRTLA
ncbi:Asp23/Gls24 family envelope stress response protein [Streptomonospora litoralis]|uniref:Alkaline shock response membrane anchor protein AmaP n=1 Tax=Streptomonospora litoralis TaxID=2498135 RepID=A0A4P6Q1N0_9ACTN|nr:alkaline shock response membrane anchor protein AmaP [Streptomonospora litoralis]QBI52719.1 hypothetical protein EKD16_04560 [Streptomonospora litoralis]